MCGILGQVSLEKLVDRDEFERMLSTLAQRGPDGHGVHVLADAHVALGHTRLSIIDLSSAGAQPMSNEDGTVWLTFNGEIYNFRALRQELELKGHVFKSHADSESIIHAYEEWGVDCVKRLRGIFAFGIYDCRARSLFIARDHIGVKPLYYYIDTGIFLFASQPRAILECADYRKALDHNAFSLYLAYGNVPAEHSIYAGIKKLLPGHWLQLHDGKTRMQQYWALRYEPVIRDASEARALVQEKIRECIQSQSVSDVPIGTLLSGGVDSTIITSKLASQTDRTLSTFTVGFDEEQSDERQYAGLVAGEFRTRHHESLLTYATACALLPDIVDAYDEPFHLNGLFPFYALSRLVQSKEIKVVLGGDGADEVFAGYLWYERFLKERGRPVDASWLSALFTRFTGISTPGTGGTPIETYFRYNGFFGPVTQDKFVGRALQGIDLSAVYKPLERHWHPEYPSVLAAQILDFNCFLVDHCLAKVDRASMACGVEVRVPFLDIELVELAFSVDHRVTFRANQRKALLKEAMGHAFPAKVDTDRKKGFSSPLNCWLERGLSQAGEALLMHGALCAGGYLDPDSVRTHFAQRMPGERLLLIGAELWYRRWIENDHSAADELARRASSEHRVGPEPVH